MNSRIKIGLIAAAVCLAMPLLCRVPRGSEWVWQYLPDSEHFISWMLLFGVAAMIPAGLVFCAALLSKPPCHLPVLLSTAVALMMLGWWHHDNDLASDAQAALSLIFIPIYAAGCALIGGFIGWGMQALIQMVRILPDEKKQ